MCCRRVANRNDPTANFSFAVLLQIALVSILMHELGVVVASNHVKVPIVFCMEQRMTAEIDAVSGHDDCTGMFEVGWLEHRLNHYVAGVGFWLVEACLDRAIRGPAH